MNKNPQFQATRWSLIQKIKQDDTSLAERAANELFSIYWHPLFVFASRQWNLNQQDAEDLIQGFIQKIIEKQLLHNADAELGKLRTYLLTAFQRYMISEYKKQTAQKRGSGMNNLSIDEFSDLKDVSSRSPDKEYDLAWRKCVQKQTEAQLLKTSKNVDETQILLNILKNGSNSEGGYESIADELGITQESLRKKSSRFAKKYALEFRNQVAQTLPDYDSEQIDEEVRYLLRLKR